MSSICASAAWLKPRSLRSCRTRDPTKVLATSTSITTAAKAIFAGLAAESLVAVSESVSTSAGSGLTGLAKTMMPVPDPHPDVFDIEWPLRVADVDREGRLKFDAATRHIQDVGSDQLREMGFEETHPLWIVRRTMIDMIEPIEFKDMLRLRRWCSGTSNRWCEMRVRIDGRRGGLHRVRGVLDQHQPRDAGACAHLRRLHRGPADAPPTSTGCGGRRT